MTATLAQIPAAPGRLPLLGHALHLWRRPLSFLCSLRAEGEYLALVARDGRYAQMWRLQQAGEGVAVDSGTA